MKSSRIYIVENLDCANCAAKMERKIQALPGVEDASITFATKQLRITAENPDELLPLIEEACSSVEPDVKILPKEAAHKEHSEQEHTHHAHGCDCEGHEHHDHEHACSCGDHHDHSHEHDHAEAASKSSQKDAHEHEEKNHDLAYILTGAAFFIAGILTGGKFPLASLLLFLIAYLILGLETLWTAFRNILRGNIFDENFLMSIATIGAFIIKEYPEAVGVMLFYRIGEWFEHRAIEKSRSRIMEALDLRPETVNLVCADGVKSIPAADAKPGDVLLVRPGDRIPLDGIIVEGESRIDTSPITGEPVPVSVTTDSSVLSGCMNLSGVLKLRVEKPLSESMVTRILDSVENAAAGKPKIDRFLTRFSRVYTPFVVLTALCTAVIPSLITGNPSHWVYTALTFLVISCPCALVLSVPLAFFSGIGVGSAKGILFKGGASLEALKKVKAVVFDKTGTITKGNFAVQRVVSLDASLTENELLALAASCEAASTHPIAQSICEEAAKRELVLSESSSVTEIPGHGIVMETQEGTVLCGNRKLMELHKIDISAYAPSASGAEVLLAKNGNFIGYLFIADTLKEDAVLSIKRLKKAGLHTVMLTGDAEENAKAIAEETGLDAYYARLLPEEKLEKLTKIRAEKGAVLFVGDGINDAPVLAGADVGAAMGSGADAAIEAADVVFLNAGLSSVPAAIDIAAKTGRTAIQNVVFALFIKALVMVLGLFGIASMWLAVFADTGVAMLCILNSVRMLYKK